MRRWDEDEWMVALLIAGLFGLCFCFAMMTYWTP